MQQHQLQLLLLSLIICNYGFVNAASRNLALFKPTSSSSVELDSGNYLYSQFAVDGDLKTRYGSIFAETQYFLLDFEEVTSFSIIEITWEDAISIGYSIQVSNDSISWQTILTKNQVDGEIDVTSDLTTSSRYIQFIGFDTSINEKGFSYWEFAVYQGECSPNLPCETGCCDFEGNCVQECTSNCYSAPFCDAGQCSGDPQNCDDFIPCTYDYCDESSGTCMNPPKDCSTTLTCAEGSCDTETGDCTAIAICDACTMEVIGFRSMFSPSNWDIYRDGSASVDFCSDLILYNADADVEVCIYATGVFSCDLYYHTYDSSFYWDPPYYYVDGRYYDFNPYETVSVQESVENEFCFGIYTVDGVGGAATLLVTDFTFSAPNQEIFCDENRCVDCSFGKFGTCVYTLTECDKDHDLCTVEYCDAETGDCAYSHDVVCNDDGDGCTIEYCDSSCGSCRSDILECKPDLNFCTDEYCDSEIGECVSVEYCDDNNACTIDSCNSEIGCSYENLNCNDEDECTYDYCDYISGCGHGDIICDDYNSCTNEYCDSELGCIYENVNCSDGVNCTYDECNPALPEGSRCIHHPVVVCSSTDLCIISSCDEKTLQCVETPNDCDDGLYCTIDSCVSATGCKHVPRDCDDKNACTNDFCDNLNKKCQNIAKDCNDDNLCTTDSCTSSGLCKFTSIECNDHNECTADYCSPERGCVFTPISCEDGNLCTSDSCDPSTGCKYTNDCAPTGCTTLVDCNFGTISGCDEVSCFHGECTQKETDCNDGNVCTSDECISGRCFHLKLCS